MIHRSTEELLAGLDHVRASPDRDGRLEMIVRRPDVDEREVLEDGRLDLAVGLVGDSWIDRPSTRTDDGSPHPDMQLNVINARLVDLVAVSRERWPLAGDQLYVDLDLAAHTTPPGTRLVIGEAEIEVTDQPHRGCAKFRTRFGAEALKLINSPEGRTLQLRGINARVVVPGRIRAGDTVVKSPPAT